MKTSFLPLLLLAALILTGAANAAQIILNNSSVIGGSGRWSIGNYDDSSVFDAFKVVDQQTGVIVESGVGNYWLGRENTLTNTGYTNEYFVLDLGSEYYLDQIDLFNTHNGIQNDRGTQNFTIQASNAVTLVDANVDYDLLGGTQILGGTLAFQTSANDPIEAETFTSGNGLSTGTAYRYLKFTAVDFHTPNGGGFPQGSGLSEIRVFGVPEPSRTLFVLLGTALLSQVRRRHR